jgi:hypothetical protein
MGIEPTIAAKDLLAERGYGPLKRTPDSLMGLHSRISLHE